MDANALPLDKIKVKRGGARLACLWYAVWVLELHCKHRFESLLEL